MEITEMLQLLVFVMTDIIKMVVRFVSNVPALVANV
jgi:hypothetical protein